MRCFVSFVCFMSVLVYVSSAPFLPGQISGSLQLGPGGGSSSGGGSGGLGGLGGLTDILSQIDLPGLLRGVNSVVKLVGVFCPPLSQVLDNVIQNVTSTAFRVFGRAILQSGGLGGSSNSGGSGGQKVSVVLPTFPPDEYDDEEEEESTTPAGSNKEAEQIKDSSNELSDMKEGPYPPSSASETSDDASNAIAKRHVRVPRAAEAEQAAEEAEHNDQEGAESAPEPAEDLSNVEDVDDQDRDKRYTADHGHAGSGNFLFDIIRVSGA
nr:unnamed protein product [Callosobruchus chinensis]